MPEFPNPVKREIFFAFLSIDVLVSVVLVLTVSSSLAFGRPSELTVAEWTILQWLGFLAALVAESAFVAGHYAGPALGRLDPIRVDGMNFGGDLARATGSGARRSLSFPLDRMREIRTSPFPFLKPASVRLKSGTEGVWPSFPRASDGSALILVTRQNARRLEEARRRAQGSGG